MESRDLELLLFSRLQRWILMEKMEPSEGSLYGIISLLISLLKVCSSRFRIAADSGEQQAALPTDFPAPPTTLCLSPTCSVNQLPRCGRLCPWGSNRTCGCLGEWLASSSLTSSQFESRCSPKWLQAVFLFHHGGGGRACSHLVKQLDLN